MSARTTRPGPGEYAPFYSAYIARVPDGDIVSTLRTGIDDTCRVLESAGEAGADHACAPGKWTIREIIGHLCDGERIFAARALRFARSDPTPLPGFDEKLYVPAGNFGARSLANLIAELRTVRAATVSLFDGFADAAWSRSGTANNAPVTVRALAWITAGHELHHCAILEERYLPGLTR
ncbi:MAG: DinB family protein [Gemmatimonadetes bacterium]|nr:DinB family protein [Gemmatimonadota bacterium]